MTIDWNSESFAREQFAERCADTVGGALARVASASIEAQQALLLEAKRRIMPLLRCEDRASVDEALRELYSELEDMARERSASWKKTKES